MRQWIKRMQFEGGYGNCYILFMGTKSEYQQAPSCYKLDEYSYIPTFKQIAQQPPCMKLSCPESICTDVLSQRAFPLT